MGNELIENIVTCTSMISLALSLILLAVFKLFGFNAKKELTKLKIMKLSADVSQVSSEQLEKEEKDEEQKKIPSLDKRMSKSCVISFE